MNRMNKIVEVVSQFPNRDRNRIDEISKNCIRVKKAIDSIKKLIERISHSIDFIHRNTIKVHPNTNRINQLGDQFKDPLDSIKPIGGQETRIQGNSPLRGPDLTGTPLLGV
jgi:hypothetical protein